MAEQFRGGLRLSPPESEWVRSDPIASNAESAKKIFWRNKNFRSGIRRGLGGINLFRGSPPRTRADLRRIGRTSAAATFVWPIELQVHCKDQSSSRSPTRDIQSNCRKTQSVPPPEKTQGWISLSFMCNCFVFGLILYKCIRVNIRAI